MITLAPLLAVLAPALVAPTGAQATVPDPVAVRWGGGTNEEAWLWEVAGSTEVVWFLPGGSWTQAPGGFQPAAMSPLLVPLYEAGISVGVSGYDTEAVFPQPEVTLEGLVLHSRGALGYHGVTLLGRSAGAHMALFNGVVAQGPAAADRVCALQTPAAFLPVFAAFPSSQALAHYWPGASFLGQVPTQVQVEASSGYWPLVFPAAPGRRFGIVGTPKALEAPLLPLPLGQLVFGQDTHSEWSSQFQAFTLQTGGWDAEFVDVHNGGAPLDPSAQASAWILGELGL